MKVKKYIGSTMPEIMKKVRTELGSDAVILNSKVVRNGGFLGLFKKRQIEVIAALDPHPVLPSQSKQRNHHSPMRKSVVDSHNSTVLHEINHLKRILEQQVKGKKEYTPDNQLIYQYLIDQEVYPTLAKDLMDTVINDDDENNDLKPEQMIHNIQLEIKKRITKTSFQLQSITQHKVFHFVGPTGVGKTTTLAKIAANQMLHGQKKIAFITMDTYRIAAIDQLKTYARILDVPVEVAYSIDDYHQAVKKFSRYDVILVDTAGRNFRDAKYVKDMKANMDHQSKTYLVLALTAKPKDIIEIHDQFKHLSINEVIFTKIDETTQFGSMLNIALNNNVNIAYLTNGQNVPDDLIQPTPEQISNYILGGYFDE